MYTSILIITKGRNEWLRSYITFYFIPFILYPTPSTLLYDHSSTLFSVFFYTILSLDLPFFCTILTFLLQFHFFPYNNFFTLLLLIPLFPSRGILTSLIVSLYTEVNSPVLVEILDSVAISTNNISQSYISTLRN